MTTRTQDVGFIDYMITSAFLENAISWIADNMEPEDVFSDTQLAAWAEANGFIQEDKQ